ncbi:MAG: hypothetical protein CL920_34825 [Deltaproteobacteria bacterium]|nr:hypothetical protein [Deltaproteobacteria bacterium]MBU53897.1 hypothetical protein [Deltaproteobacteria bacterium]
MKSTLKSITYALLLLGCTAYIIPQLSFAAPAAQSQDEDDDVIEPGDETPTKRKKPKKKPPKRRSTETEDESSDTELSKEKVAEKTTEKPEEKAPDAGTDNTDEPSDDSSSDESSKETSNADAGSGTLPPEKPAQDAAPTKETSPPTPVPSETTAKTAPEVDNKAGTRLVMELQFLWGIAVLLALAFLLQLLNFILPFQAMSFLSMGANLLIWLTGLGYVGVNAYRILVVGHVPGDSLYTGTLWFSLIVTFAHLHKRRTFRNIYISALFVLPILLGSTIWSLSTIIPLQATPVAEFSSTWRHIGNICMYTGFGYLATSGAWQLAAGFLGILGRSQRGTGYGLKEPRQWEEFGLQPTSLAMFAYPLLTIAWTGHLLWSMQQFANPWQAWFVAPRTWAVLFSWLVLSAYFMAVRIPTKNKHAEFENWDAPEKRGILPGLLLFVASAGGALLFVGMTYLLKLLQG